MKLIGPPERSAVNTIKQQLHIWEPCPSHYIDFTFVEEKSHKRVYDIGIPAAFGECRTCVTKETLRFGCTLEFSIMISRSLARASICSNCSINKSIPSRLGITSSSILFCSPGRMVGKVAGRAVAGIIMNVS